MPRGRLVAPAAHTPGAAERLIHMTGAIANASSSAEVVQVVVDQVVETMGASSAAIWLVGEDARTVRLAHTRGASEQVKQAHGFDRLDTAPSAPHLQAIRLGHPIWRPSPCLPLCAQGRVLGVLALTLEAAAEPSDEERSVLLLIAGFAARAVDRLRLSEAESRSRRETSGREPAGATRAVDRGGRPSRLEDLTDRAAVAIENSRLYQEAIDAQARAERLYSFAQSVVVADSIDGVLTAAVDAIESLLGTRRSAILILDDEGVMRFRAWRNLSDSYRAAVDGHSPWSRDAAAPEPIVVTDAETDGAMSSFRPLFRSEGIRALAFIPLVSSGRLLGKFMVYYDHRRSFLPHELEMACAIANHLASVIARFSAVAKLEETVRYNELFGGILAHDLRNPLGAMMMAAQLLIERSEDEKAIKPLHRIVGSGERMRRMIDQLLDFTRARLAGGIELHRRPVSLSQLARQALDEIELTMTSSTFRLETIGDLQGEWDADRLAQVFSNLAANAAQHGSAGHAVVVRLDGRDRRTVEIELSNRGVIHPDLLRRLFEPFRHTQHTRIGSRGLGLGLFITQQIIRAHGGEIAVTSSEAEGTVFRIHIPRRGETAASFVKPEHAVVLSGASVGPAAGGGPPGPDRKHQGGGEGSVGAPLATGPVLVVDDDADIREALADLLTDRGFVVITANNGADALQLLRTLDGPPSLILLDIMMPVMNGYEFLDQQLGDPALASIPVAIITAGHAIDRSRLAGAVPILSKPINVPLLMDTLRRL